MKPYKFITDPGHGWLEVPLTELIAAGLDKNISSYSYINPANGNVYLEEDSDAGKFIEAMVAESWQANGYNGLDYKVEEVTK